MAPPCPCGLVGEVLTDSATLLSKPVVLRVAVLPAATPANSAPPWPGTLLLALAVFVWNSELVIDRLPALPLSWKKTAPPTPAVLVLFVKVEPLTFRSPPPNQATAPPLAPASEALPVKVSLVRLSASLGPPPRMAPPP